MITEGLNVDSVMAPITRRGMLRGAGLTGIAAACSNVNFSGFSNIWSALTATN